MKSKQSICDLLLTKRCLVVEQEKQLQVTKSVTPQILLIEDREQEVEWQSMTRCKFTAKISDSYKRNKT